MSSACRNVGTEVTSDAKIGHQLVINDDDDDDDDTPKAMMMVFLRQQPI